MARWTFEPGHTAAEFKARHMMVTWVRGHFVNIHGTLQFDPAAPARSTVEVEIDVSTLWSGEPQRDEHLLSADFLDVAHDPKMVFKPGFPFCLPWRHLYTPRAAEPTKLSSSHNRPAPEAVTSARADVRPTGAVAFFIGVDPCR